MDVLGLGNQLDGEGAVYQDFKIVEQYQGTAQGLVTSKARLAKRGLTVPRLELVSSLMATKFLDNVKAVLDGLPIRHCYSWLDSMVALYWISGRGSYKQFCRKSSETNLGEKLYHMETRRNER